MKKGLVIGFSSLLLFGVLSGCSGSPSGQGTGAAAAGDPIKIGVIVPETGDSALSGTLQTNGIQLKTDEINSSGGLLGGRQVQLVMEDDQGTDSGAVNAFNKIQGEGVTAVIGSIYSTANVAISSAVQKAGIPTTVSGSSKAIAALQNPWMFQVRTPDSISAKALVNFAIDTVKLKKPAILYDTDTFGTGGMTVATDTLQALGITPAVVVSYNTGSKDFTAQFMKIKDSGADGILAWSQQTEAGLIMQQKTSLGIDIPMIGSNSFASQISLSVAKDTANGVYAIADFVPTTTSPTGQKFAASYKAKYNIDADFDGAIGYDAMSLIANAITTANSTDPAAIQTALANTKDFDGVCTTFTFDADHVGGTGAQAVQIENQSPKVLAQVSGV